jgi:hypothetical protein
MQRTFFIGVAQCGRLADLSEDKTAAVLHPTFE